MVNPRTVELLPEVFRTDTNRKFLSATLDQLTQEANTKRTQGYVGRRVGPGVNPQDAYVVEPSATRSDYQLEPGVIFLKTDTNKAIDAITWPGIIDALGAQGANTNRQDRLFQSQYYSWDPFCDLDKFSNYSQYYWLPGGPDSVNVGTTQVLEENAFTVTRNATNYMFSDIVGENPILTLVRGGNYTFDVNQPGHNFWIQSQPGVSGKLSYSPNISSRDVLGVTNNGVSGGTVTFNVPRKSDQDFYYTLTNLGTVDLITNLSFDQLNNVYVNQFQALYPTGIDGITDLNNRTIVFTSTTGWANNSQFDPLTTGAINNGQPGSFDTLPFDQTTYIDDPELQYSVWVIQYVTDDAGNPYMTLGPSLAVPQLSKFSIRFGEEYSSTQWYKNASGYFEQIPLLTAIQDTLYYQDSTNSEIFGQIKLIDQSQAQPLFLDDIIGAKNYTSPNGVVFTNGLKVQFRGPTVPAQYQNLEFYVEGVGTGPGIATRVGFVDGEAYYGPFHYSSTGQLMTGSVADSIYFQQYIYETVAESLIHRGAGGPVGAPYPTKGQFGAILGNGIKLLPVRDFVTPETYTQSQSIPYDSVIYDSTPYDASLNAPEVPDYLTINRAAQDRNAWSRSNRWFHVDVLRATATYNNQTLSLDNKTRGKRPIIEFRANINLYDSGTQAKDPVNIIDFVQTDAFTNVNGTTGYSTDGYTLINGSTIIFAADNDNQVRNQVYQVRFIDPNNSGQYVIDLVPVVNGTALINQSVVCLNGTTQQGKTHWFNGITWILAQQKISVNQPPLFDVYGPDGQSFSNSVAYPSTTFKGSRLFGYAPGTTTLTDEVLGFALRYLSINNVGDIVFQNFLYSDTFIYVKDNASITENVSAGFIREYIDRTTFSEIIGWIPAAAENRSRQEFRFTYTGEPLILDVPVATDTVYPALQLFIEGKFIDPTKYTYSIVNQSTVINIGSSITTGVIIEVTALSNVASKTGFYEVASNLENNPLNQNSNSFTLGTIRTHYESIGENLKNIVGPINGANNTRDLGNILAYGDNIIQNSAPATLTGAFLRSQQYEIFNSLIYNSNEYTKYKNLLLDLTIKGDFTNYTATQILDTVTQDISVGRDNIAPFYWSDMLPATQTFAENTYIYSPISTNVFDTLRIYDFTTSNFQGVLVFLNGRILTKNYDYTVGTTSATITISVPLAVGDQIVIREYETTYGSFVPNTPTKMGLYPAYKPEIYVDTSYLTPTPVIRGHDGSITVAFSDIRDEVLLEFETRIFNNLKIQSAVPLTIDAVVPGQFRTTEYSLSEINSILVQDFLAWVGANKLDYTSQTYLAADEFTYNFSQCENKLSGNTVLGAWRGIYNYFYDTYTPNMTPWEMLGFSQEPTWWQSTYGPAPYTSGNLVLWDDLSRGYVNDPNGPYFLPEFARPGLLNVIPSGPEGELLNPLETVISDYDSTSFRRSWAFGDGAPVENVWRTSSAWPFAVMRLLALTKPAEFFSVFADRDRYVFDRAIGQYLWDGRYRLDAGKLNPLYGSGTSKASFINWIIDYNRQLGFDSTATLTTTLANIDVRLCWRLAAFSDKKYLKIYTERSSPNSLNNSLLLPDESYELLLYKNQPFDQLSYSSVIIQSTGTGWAVLGYNPTKPYFDILVSLPTANTVSISAGGSAVNVSADYSNNVARVPYGYVFTSRAAVCDFLLSYGRLLNTQGFTFESIENGHIINWTQMAQEFLYWSNQGWVDGSMINLNPGASRLSVTRANSIVDNLTRPSIDNVILNQNRQQFSLNDLVIDRLDTTFRLTSTNQNTINYLNVLMTSYEHVIVLDNVSQFADLIYDPVTGARQSRIRVNGTLSADWNGTVNAPGFILNQDNILPWSSAQKYAKGEIVLFKNEYWSASTIIQPGQAFDYNLWIKSDYDQIQKGLLPNAANDSDQLAMAYSVYDANLEQDVDLFSYGLIGFRPRQYMQSLNLDDVSQVNLYQQFLGTKGTVRSAELFSLANLGKEVAEYNIYEYWSMLRGSYGATANRSYFELLLNEAKLESNPALIQVVLPQETSVADQTVLVKDIWKSSYRITNPNILPIVLEVNPDRALPTAGYPNLEDVDITTFDLVNSDTLLANFDTIKEGTVIWVAKINQHDWAIYESYKVPGFITTIAENLDGRSSVDFSEQHGLSVGDTLIIKNFDANINGIYTVRSLVDLYTVLIDYTFTGTQNVATGTGISFTLKSLRVAQPADILDIPNSTYLLPGTKVWVDNNGRGQWTVLEKTNPFTQNTSITATVPVAGSRYGASVSQGLENLTALIGAPDYGQDLSSVPPGAVYTLVQAPTGEYVQNSILTLNASDASGYGNDVDTGAQEWAIVGASTSYNSQGYASVIYVKPNSNIFEQRQLLVAPVNVDRVDDAEFGFSVVMAREEDWLYVSAPGRNKVYAFAKVDVQEQQVVYTTDGIIGVYNWSDYIDIDYTKPQQLDVLLDNTPLYSTSPNQGYTVTGGNIVLNVVPGAGQILTISRKNVSTLDQRSYFNVEQSSVSPAGGSDALFTVNNLRGQYNATTTSGGTDYSYNDVLTISGTAIGGTAPANNLTITVTQTGITYNTATNIVAGASSINLTSVDGLFIGQELHQVSGSGTIGTNTTVTSIDVGTNTIQVSVPNAVAGEVTFFASPGPITAFTQSGNGIDDLSVFDLRDYFATVTNDIFSFTVTVNGQLYRPYHDYDYTTGVLTFINSMNPPRGAKIVINASSHYNYVTDLTVPGLPADARFGHSITTSTNSRQVVVGTPDNTFTIGGTTYTNAGTAYVFDRSTQKFIVQDNTTTQYNTVQSLIAPTAVLLNGQHLLDTDLNFGGQFTVTGANQVTLSSGITSIGDVLEVETNHFLLTQTIVANSPSSYASFGHDATQCVYDCSLFVGAPLDSSALLQAGSAEFFLNQSRIYGTTTSTIANPVLTPGEYIRVDNLMIELSQPDTWSSAQTWSTNSFVENSGIIYKALQPVPVNIDITDALYWKISGWVDVLAADINANAMNVVATPTDNLLLIGDGATQTFDVGTIYSDAESYTTVVYINGGLVGGYTYNNSTTQITFNTAPSNGAEILIMSGRLTIAIKNSATVPVTNKLQVLPGDGTLFADVGINTYIWQQTIVSPVPQSYSRFGHTVKLGGAQSTLTVGAPNGSMIKPTTFDRDTTIFDFNSTNFLDQVLNSGAVYTFDPLAAVNPSPTNPSQYVFGQQIIDQSIQSLDGFGTAIDYTTGILLLGAPGNDIGDVTQQNYGSVINLSNKNQDPAWATIELQQPFVDIERLNTTYMYDRVASPNKEYFDFFDPLQGRLLGPVRQNLDYIGAIDPGAYNVGLINNFGSKWTGERVGQIWWDTTNARFINPFQRDSVYASRRWGQLFPGSTVQVYQWIESDVPPAEYVGPGTPYSIGSYSINSSINEQGSFSTTYYFWVTGITTVNTSAGKTLSTQSLTQYIESPRSSGISYIAPITASTIAIYNGLDYISAQDTVLHIEFDQTKNDDAVYVECQLIPQNRADGFLEATLYRKFIDSMCGADSFGNAVPDPLLPPSEKYGVQFRPRQSFFVNRLLALENYLTEANAVMALYPIAENRGFSLLNSHEPEPSSVSGAWNKRVANLEELSYQNLAEVPLGYKYLVASDSSNNGLWTIYEVTAGPVSGSKTLLLVRVETYDTTKYWNYANWYKPGYNPLTRILLTVPVYSSLATITVPVGSSVKVLANGQNKWEIYQLETTGWVRVGLQDGTIQIASSIWNYQDGRFGFDQEVFDAQYFDQQPTIETRQIIKSINEEIFVGELLLERNKLLVLMFNFILSEQQAPEWLTKTSLIDVEHTIRDLVQYQVYRQDNQDFVLNYIKEVKPYHVQIREFNLRYRGFDSYLGTVNDFDVPAYYNTTKQMFISPVLDNTGLVSSTSSTPSTDPIWQTLPWNQWYQNYLLEIQSVIIASGGTGYTTPPEVIVTGTCVTPAVMTAVINSAGQVTAINVVNPGAGYSTTASIALIGGNGTGARAVAQMGNSLVRSLSTTIKYDRYQYNSSIIEWQPNVEYASGVMVRYDDRVWAADAAVSSNEFDPTDWTLVAASSLSGVDRTMGFYVPAVNEPGLDLSQLISGVTYPGVQVQGPNFNQNTGYDVGNFDINPYDNLFYGPDGEPSYDPAILDAIYESQFLDPYLGTLPAPAYNGAPPTDSRPGAVEVVGGAFVDTYSSHAPEELVPGAIFDTLDMRVFTTPGADWQGVGHGFMIDSKTYIFNGVDSVFSFAQTLDHVTAVRVWNTNTGTELYPDVNYTVDWVDQTITVTSGINANDLIDIGIYQIGGGNELFIDSYFGADTGSTLVVPMTSSMIESVAVFVNGQPIAGTTWEQYSTTETELTFTYTFDSTEKIVVALFGNNANGTLTSWSMPVTQYFVSAGELSYQLDNSLSGTNPANIVVTKNGIRARPAEAVEYVTDASTIQYALPMDDSYSQGSVADNDVAVYIDTQPLTLGTQFLVDAWDGSTQRTITLLQTPATGSKLLISVRTNAVYYVSGDQLIFKSTGGFIPIAGDIISATTWNDTSEQNILTQVFVGPSTTGQQITEPYDTTNFDEGFLDFAPGAFDYSEGTLVKINKFNTGREILNNGRLLVTLDGAFLFPNIDFDVDADGTSIVIPGIAISDSSVVVITSFTQSVASQAIAFRIFQDMRGLQSTYRITDNSTTKLTQNLESTDDVIYVDDASKLTAPSLEFGIFGIITIDGERITYRTRNTVTNTLSGLRRGTAGTGAADHNAGTDVYDIGRGNLLPTGYQNYINYQNFLGDGSTTEFVATDVTSDETVEFVDQAVEVYVAGAKQTSGYTVTSTSPITVDFATAPSSGYQVSIQVEKAQSWYQPGATTASDGVPLQETDTSAARFIRSN